MDRLRWGVLSTAKIGVEKVIPAMQQSELCEIVAISSRDLNKARKAAESLGIPRSFGSYEELIQDPEVEAIYNPLPNHLHVPWSVRALEAGKHVLCEKPIALTSREGQELVDAARAFPSLKVMEAFMYRHHPQWREALRRVRLGELGEIHTIQSFFSYFNEDPDNIRNKPEMGGGGLMDIGCYCISLSRFLFGAEPARVIGAIDMDARFGTDRLASGILQFQQGTSTFTCSTQLEPFQRVNVFGEAGRLEIEIPFNAPPDRPCRIFVQKEEQVEEISLATCDQYTVQGDLFSKAVLEDSPVPTPIEDSVANMRVIEAILASARTERWEAVQS